MKNENVELLKFIYKDSSMGVHSLNVLLETLKEKENKIKNVAEDILKSYEKFLKKSKEKLHKYKSEERGENIMALSGSYMGIKMEMMKDNSDSRVAEMLIKGLTMGNINATKKIDDYKNIADKKELNFLKEFQSFQNEAINKLKKFL